MNDLAKLVRNKTSHPSPNIIPHHVINTRLSWRKLPELLNIVREYNLDIRRAFIENEECVLFVRNEPPKQVAHGYGVAAEHVKLISPTSYCKNDQVLIYNVKDKCTVLEFTCMDKRGLLLEMIDMLASLSIQVELKTANISCINNVAHNIFHLMKEGKALSEDDMTYIRNVLEYDFKIPNVSLISEY